MSTQTVLNAGGIEKALDDMIAALLGRPGDGPWAIVGIRRGGDYLAKRLVAVFEKNGLGRPPMGVVDITLYRDDGFGPHQFPQVGITNIPFKLPQHTIILVDDVLYTGRTVRAALDVILDYGRPRAVRLAVLVDRGLQELPIRADAVGMSLPMQPHHHVDVQLVEAGAAQDAVVVYPRKERP